MNEDVLYLLKSFDIQSEIIDRCFKRDVPQENLYWKNTQNYIGKNVRFLSIPLWLELAYSTGEIQLETLLSDEYFEVLEKILHYSEEEELKLISFEECIDKCFGIKFIKNQLTLNPKLEDEIKKLIISYPAYQALKRGNFLMVLPLLVSHKKKEVIDLIYLLIDLIICGCIIDDLHDVKVDAINNEPNIIIELGNDINSLFKAKKIYDNSATNLVCNIPGVKEYLSKSFLNLSFEYLNNKKV